jgi:hypothetical protein
MLRFRFGWPGGEIERYEVFTALWPGFFDAGQRDTGSSLNHARKRP